MHAPDRLPGNPVTGATGQVRAVVHIVYIYTSIYIYQSIYLSIYLSMHAPDRLPVSPVTGATEQVRCSTHCL